MMKSLNRILLLSMIALGLAACEKGHVVESKESSTITATETSESSIEGFATTVYAFGQTHGCVKCHANRVSPKWANEDVKVAYDFARPFVDFANPVASIYASYVSNNHCGDPICADPSNEAVMQNLLTQWALIEVQQGGSTGGSIAGATLPNPPYVSSPVAIVNPLPLITTTQVATLKFNLSEVAPAVASLAGATLEISIQSFNSVQNEYKVFNPRIYGNIRPISLRGLHIYVRPASGSGLGVEDVIQGDQWSGISATVAPVSAPGTSLSPIVLGIEAQSEADVITVGFADVH